MTDRPLSPTALDLLRKLATDGPQHADNYRRPTLLTLFKRELIRPDYSNDDGLILITGYGRALIAQKEGKK